MLTVRHLNCGTLHAPPNPPAACHCLLLEAGGRLALVDTGIGLRDVADPVGRIGQQMIDVAGFQFREDAAAVRQLAAVGIDPAAVTDILLTHGDPDHAGGLADFPAATVHVSEEELAALGTHWRYRMPQFDHGPRWKPHPPGDRDWFGLPARPVDFGPGADVLLVPLFGHTLGHCGVAVRLADKWLLHVGDAYFLRGELETDDHPVTPLAVARAIDNDGRVASLAHLRRLARDHAGEVEMIGYHDFTEFPAGWPTSSA